MFPSLLRDLYEPTDYRYSILPCGVSATPYFTVRQPPQVPVAPRRSDAKKDSSKLQVMFNVKDFRPDQIDVKTVDNFVVIHGKHEEQAHQYGFVSREFTRRYWLPDDVEPHTVTSSLSQDGVLTIEAPEKCWNHPQEGKNCSHYNSAASSYRSGSKATTTAPRAAATTTASNNSSFKSNNNSFKSSNSSLKSNNSSNKLHSKLPRSQSSK
ncbi:protein lethal(2)essential for life [Caerostris extrusa]|uniref:Protein lethal(2)essential for life n=1 Tax=Caerostris extrusa TaxID=172846 RepID=A0AAV4NKW0_CAEEX|nr:protein lethal(2)essential for life [Caerostris extrusa]